MVQGASKQKTSSKKVAKKQVHSKKVRSRALAKRTPKRVERTLSTKQINSKIERLTAGRAAAAGATLEMTTLNAVAKESCRDLRRKALDGKKKKKKTQAANDHHANDNSSSSSSPS